MSADIVPAHAPHPTADIARHVTKKVARQGRDNDTDHRCIGGQPQHRDLKVVAENEHKQLVALVYEIELIIQQQLPAVVDHGS